MIAEVLIFVIIALLSYIIWNRTQKFKLRERLGLHGPPVNFISGNLSQLKKQNDKSNMPVLSRLKEWRQQYGDVYGYYLGPKLVVFVADLDMIKEITIKKFDCFTDRMHFALSEPEPTCHSLINIDGEKWKQIRHAITPTFTASKMKQMSCVINEKIDTLLGKMEKFAAKEETFDIFDHYQALTLDVIGQCAFALKVDCQTNENDQFLVDVKEIFRLFDIRNFPLISIALVLPELRWFFSKLRLHTKLNELEQRMLKSLRNVLETRKSNFKESKSVDVLHLLLEQQADTVKESQKEWKLTDNVIVANAYTFLLAGYETTSTALAFTTWLLAKHQDVQKKLQEEIDEKFELNQNADVNYDFVNKMPYMDAVFHESLRFFPPVIQFVQRTCVKECELGHVKFVPGVQVNIPVHAIHSDPEIWPEPEKFDPERFLGSKTYNPTGWLPFGTGPRNCIGMRFADMEAKMTLVRLLRKFTVVFGPESECDDLEIMEYSILLRPKYGIRIRLVKRQL